MQVKDMVRLDHNQGALVSTDNEGLQAYKQSKRMATRLNKIDQLEQEFQELKADLSDMRTLLLHIASKLDK